MAISFSTASQYWQTPPLPTKRTFDEMAREGKRRRLQECHKEKALLSEEREGRLFHPPAHLFESLAFLSSLPDDIIATSQSGTASGEEDSSTPHSPINQLPLCETAPSSFFSEKNLEAILEMAARDKSKGKILSDNMLMLKHFCKKICLVVNRVLQSGSTSVALNGEQFISLRLFADLQECEKGQLLHLQIVDLDSKIGEGGQTAVYRGATLNIALEKMQSLSECFALLSTVSLDTSSKDADLKCKAYKILELSDEVLMQNHIAPSFLARHEGGNSRVYLEQLFIDSTLQSNLSPFSVRRALPIMQQLLQALALLHSKGLSHGDIKLPNILITKNDSIYLTDLGTAARINGERWCVPYDSTNQAPYFCWDLCSLNGFLTNARDVFGAVLVLGMLVFGSLFSDFMLKRELILQKGYSSLLQSSLKEYIQHLALLPSEEDKCLKLIATNSFLKLIAFFENRDDPSSSDIAFEIAARMQIHKMILEYVQLDAARLALLKDNPSLKQLLKEKKLNEPAVKEFKAQTEQFSVIIFKNKLNEISLIT